MNTKKVAFWGTIPTILAVLLLSLAVFPLKKDNRENFRIRDKEVKVEVVTDPKEQQKGLGGRESLCENCGMLFVFPEKKKESFWMKDMRFDLDIIWIADRRVGYIFKNADHSSLKRIDPSVPSDMVLEANSGFCDKFGIKVGDKAVLK